jgi:uncharacterized membrane protein SpoIIM required for sporulation
MIKHFELNNSKYITNIFCHFIDAKLLNYLHGAEFFMKSWSTNTPTFIESGSSIVGLFTKILSLVPYFCNSTLTVFSHLLLEFSSVLFPSGFPFKISYAVISPMRDTCSAHLAIFDLITLIMTGEEYKKKAPQ